MTELERKTMLETKSVRASRPDTYHSRIHGFELWHNKQ